MPKETCFPNPDNAITENNLAWWRWTGINSIPRSQWAKHRPTYCFGLMSCSGKNHGRLQPEAKCLKTSWGYRISRGDRGLTCAVHAARDSTRCEWAQTTSDEMESSVSAGLKFQFTWKPLSVHQLDTLQLLAHLVKKGFHLNTNEQFSQNIAQYVFCKLGLVRLFFSHIQGSDNSPPRRCCRC